MSACRLFLGILIGMFGGAVYVGCGASYVASVEAAHAPPTASSSGDRMAPLPPGHVWREQVMRVMSPGMGAFLGRIEVRERLTEEGQFFGFEIVRLRLDPSFWQDVDLRPGDVITSVNRQPVEHYGLMYRVWQSLATAPELVVTYERAGQVRQLRYVIHDEGTDGGLLPKIPDGFAPPIWDAGTLG